MSDTPAAPLVSGTVFRVQSGSYSVQTSEGIVVCKLRGNLKKELVYTSTAGSSRRVSHTKKRRSTDPLAVGDHVLLDFDLQMIEQTLPRHSELSRDSPSGRGQHVLVANLDCVYIVFAAANPSPDLTLLDRFLVLTEAADLTAAIIVNKLDLMEDNQDAARALFAVYEQIGYPVFYTCAKRGWGTEEVRQALQNRISAFAGPSGVGKSSLLNQIQPGLTLRTGDISKVSKVGKHTTTSAELLPLDGGGWVADTPGLRQIDYWEVEKGEIVYCFPEFKPYIGECRFADCRHHTELGCAIRAAVDQKLIALPRYKSFVQMTGLG